MLKNYLKVAWRNLRSNKLYSAINVVGLATGMAVAMLIGLWIYDELNFDREGRDNYDRIGMVMQFVNFGTGKVMYQSLPIPLAKDMRANYPDFERVSLLSNESDMVLTVGDKLISRNGVFVTPEFPDMMTLKMLKGSRRALNDMHAILLSESVAKSLFGPDVDPMGKVIKLSNNQNVTVQGVYKDFPNNSTFKSYSFLGAWDLYSATEKEDQNEWDSNSWYIFAQLKPGVTFAAASEHIRLARARQGDYPSYKPEFFLHPMSRLHLYMDFQYGKNVGGQITFVWLFGIIGVFVLLLACINFMNLSTARSEKRAKEVGIRKAIGSLRQQLIAQFLSESLLVAVFAFVLSLLMVELTLPFFNNLSDKSMTILWLSPLFWIAGIGFSLLTGLIAGSYPALYLSSFSAVKVLKGTFKAGRFASMPRRVLVTLQFTVSVMLIIGTIVVFRQVQYVKDIPTGYSRNNLIEVNINTQDLRDHTASLKNDLLASGAVTVFAESSCPITAAYGGTVDYNWKGKDPNKKPLILANDVTADFGRAIGWQIKEGRDFASEILTDSAAMILDETAVKTMGLQHPLGEVVYRHGKPYTVIGIAKNMVRADPFQLSAPSSYVLTANDVRAMEIRLSPSRGSHEALAKVQEIFKRYNPGSPFAFHFVDEVYAKKFLNEERIGNLATFFAVLAIFISCLGLFGLSSFVAEQRTKEIGVRKVLGASLAHVWGLLSREFVLLALISMLVAMPVAGYFMQRWLQHYEVHTSMPWWIFGAAGLGAVMITVLTVSFQAVKAGLANPVRSLRSE